MKELLISSWISLYRNDRLHLDKGTENPLLLLALAFLISSVLHTQISEASLPSSVKKIEAQRPASAFRKQTKKTHRQITVKSKRKAKSRSKIHYKAKKTTINSKNQKPKRWQRNSALKKTRRKSIYMPVNSRPSFDIPVTYNRKVRKWIKYYQGPGRNWIVSRMGRSYKFLPSMKRMLRKKKLPEDLAYIAMIESGFSATATSTASAVGHWQFIKATGNRYGLRTKWWLDERRDPRKSTAAAANYLADLYKMFDSWYLAAAAYNMGENGLKRLIRRYKSNNFWVLSKKRRFPKETREYVPKLMAAMLISKAPKLYGFKNIKPQKPHSYDVVFVPGGFDLINLAQFLRKKSSILTKLNPELIKGFVPRTVKSHRIRVPKGSLSKVTRYLRKFR